MRWLYYMLGWLQLDAVSRDSAVPGLNREAAYQRISLYPPLPEQHAIVAKSRQRKARLSHDRLGEVPGSRKRAR